MNDLRKRQHSGGSNSVKVGLPAVLSVVAAAAKSEAVAAEVGQPGFLL